MALSAMERKARFYSSSNVMRSRDLTGKSKRRERPM
jgi:hypothetical protein